MGTLPSLIRILWTFSAVLFGGPEDDHEKIISLSCLHIETARSTCGMSQRYWLRNSLQAVWNLGRL